MIRLLKTFEEDNNLNNVLVPLTLNVDELYFLYHHDISDRKINNCKKIIKKYKDIKINFLKVKEEDIKKYINKDTIVDVGAAKYLSIVLYEQALINNLPIIYYDEEERNIKQYKDHKIITKNIFKLTIEDIIKLGGGTIKSILHKPIKDNKSKEIIYKAIDYTSKNYNSFISYISKINSYIIDYPSEENIYHLKDNVIKKIINDEQYHKYKELELFEIKDNDLIFYNNEIRKIFMVSGTFLENYIYHKLLDSKLFDDVLMSCNIEFNDEKWKYPVNCEIDCLVLRNNELLFISIKSNKVEKDDLNEIKVHNVVFGNHQSKAVICTNNDLSQKKPSIYAKAEELNVYVIDNTDFINNALARKFNDIIKGTYQYERI